MFIYKITNKINGKLYIGQTIFTIEKRWHEHLLNSKLDNQYLCRAIRKHGSENFEIKAIIKCNNIDELNSREIFCIRIF